MIPASKIIRFVGKKVAYFNPIAVLARFYINGVTKKEFHQPIFPIFNERPIEYRFVFEQITSQYPKEILDVGTGLTSLPHLMANCGCHVTAIDNITDYWSYGLFNRHFHVIDDSIIHPQKVKGPFDLVTCISTLEHIEDYNNAVSSMISLLKPEGYLILTFPYNENKFVDNVYELPGSNTKKLPPFKTHCYSKKEVSDWIKNKASVVKQEYWQLYTGDFWTVGDRLAIPKKVDKNEAHQISCILIKKNK